MIAVKNLCKRYGDVRAVSDVSFHVAPGEIVGLLGQNGAGKTTVMKMITGYLEPTSGSAVIGGHDVVQERQAVQRQIGYLPENAPLYPEMLVQDYLLMLAELREVPAGERLRAVSRAVRACGLEKVLVRPIGTLSKGYRQRVGLAQAIVHRPKVLVLDEPTNGLDPVQIVEIRELIRELAKTTTIILSTHILPEIEAVCSRVVILIDGELACDESLQTLLAGHSLRVALASDESSEAAARFVQALPGIRAVKSKGISKGFERFECDCDPEVCDPANIIQLALQAHLRVGECALDQPSLEQVFRDLMAAHVARHTAEVQ